MVLIKNLCLFVYVRVGDVKFLMTGMLPGMPGAAMSG
jgi:hypothetical protein